MYDLACSTHLHCNLGSCLVVKNARAPQLSQDLIATPSQLPGVGFPRSRSTPPRPSSEQTANIPLIDAFEGRTQLFASYHMWHTGLPAAKQCEGWTFNTGQRRLELSYLHSRDVTFTVFCEGPFDESVRYHGFMGWKDMPWYSVPEESYGRLAVRGAHCFGMKACYLRDGDRVFETC